MSTHMAATISDQMEEVLVFPASSGQRRLWFLDQAEPGRPVYNVPRCARVQGDLDVERLAFAFGEIARRHEILRTTFEMSDGEPVQVVHEPRPFSIRVEDLTALAAAERESEALRLAREEAQRPFDLSTGPLLRVRLIRLEPRDHLLAITLHHIVCDGWSMAVLFGELAEFYNACRDGRAASVPDLPVQYGDFAAWERDQAGEAAFAERLEYWKQKLAGAPALNLPADRPRPARPSFRGGAVSRTLARGVMERVHAFARRSDSTPFMVCLAAFAALLGRYSGEEDVVIGAPVTNRERAEFQSLVGFFVNTVALRLRAGADSTFEQLLAEARTATLEAFRYQAPFEKVVEALHPDRKGRATPLFQVMIALETDAGERAAMNGLSFSPVPMEFDTAKFDLTLYLSDRRAGASADLTYSTDLFDPATAERMLSHFERVLAAAVEDPALRLSSLPLLSAPERQLLLEEWNRTAAEYPRDASIAVLVEQQAAGRGDGTAVVDGSARVSYGELNRGAEALAGELRRQGIGRGRAVALCLRRGADLVTAMLAVLKAGGVYVPLDPAHPPARVLQMAADAGVAVVITEERYRPMFDPAAVRVICIGDGQPAIDATAREPGARDSVDGGDPAYVIYTSGSTGRPKGVVVPHRAIARLVRNTNYVTLGERDVVAQVSNAAFDAATFEIWGALLTGAAIAVLPTEAALSAARLRSEIERAGVTTMFLTTALFNQLAREDASVFRPLRYLLFGGEAADPAAVSAVLAQGRPQHLLNVYGPTETTTFATFYEIEDGSDLRAGVPIGRPIANTTLFVLDPRRTPVPIGVPGELYIGGDGVARGYHARPDLTAERFIADPFAIDAGRRLYRTGDLVRYRADGNIEFLGRLDNQVKIRGFRVEPGEIEAALRSIEGVDEACVVPEKDTAGTVRVMAYVSSRAGTVTAAALREALKRDLPAFMVPAEIAVVGDLPLNANGKIDRAALSAIVTVPAVAARVAPRDPLEAMLVEIWQGLLGADAIGVHDDFFDLGGHSLLAARMMSEAERALGRRLPLSALLDHPTIESLATAFVDAEQAAAPQASVLLNSRGHRRPLVFLHGDINGGGLYTRNLARHLDQDRPLLVMAPPGADGRPMPASIEAIAGMQMELLRAAQPHGPYALAGYCNGGLVAFEMARQLRRCGEEVRLVAIVSAMAARTRLAAVDLAVRAWARWRNATEAERVELFLIFSEFFRQLRRRPGRERIGFAASKARIAAARISGRRNGTGPNGARRQAGAPQVKGAACRHVPELFEAYAMAVGSYVPRRYDGRVALLLPAGSASLRASADDWRRVVPKLSVRQIDGDHVSCVTRHVASLAEVLDAALTEARA